MFEIRTSIEIAAPAQRVWAVLVDFPAHPAWNPFIRAIAGRPQAGERLDITIRPEGGRGMRFRPRVLVAEPGRELRWLGRFVVPGLFDGEHYFLLEPVGGGTRLVHGERFCGLFVPMARAGLDQGTRAGFERMNEALRRRVEALA